MTPHSPEATRAPGPQMPALFLDFDNTITTVDVLDLIIERYSMTQRWRQWEDEWRAGRISTLECLEKQVSDLRVTPEQLIEFTDGIEIDSAFVPLSSWAMAHNVEISILSDNFTFIVKAMLERRGLRGMWIYANHLTFDHDRPRASFPLTDPSCDRCAHCKAQHIRRVTGRPRIFVGDGLSDICPAAAADIVFAKDSLAGHLYSIGSPYRVFQSLADILVFLEKTYGDVSYSERSARSGRR